VLRTLHITWLLFFLIVQACDPEPEISPDIMNKLDSNLQKMVMSDESPESTLTPVTYTDEGDPVYRVIVRTGDAESLRNEGLRVNTEIGTIAIARWTKAEILKAASIDSTQQIESDTDQNFPGGNR
jgi:hypothetical protein